jgi:hypothetical protein
MPSRQLTIILPFFAFELFLEPPRVGRLFDHSGAPSRHRFRRPYVTYSSGYWCACCRLYRGLLFQSRKAPLRELLLACL